MAEMYKEIHGEGEFELIKEETGIRGTRTFIRDDETGTVAAAALPVVGTGKMVDMAGTEIENCFCRLIRGVFVQGYGGAPGYRCEYSTEEFSMTSEAGAGVPRDDAAEEYDISADIDQFTPDPDIASGDYWKFEGAAADVSVVEQSLPVAVTKGTFSIPHPNQEMTEAERTAFLDKVRDQAGSINDAAFKGYSAGQVFFETVSGGNFRNSAGNLRWAFRLHFSWKSVQDPVGGAVIKTDAWLYVLSDKEGKLRKPVTNVGGKYLFRKTNFGSLLT